MRGSGKRGSGVEVHEGHCPSPQVPTVGCGDGDDTVDGTNNIAQDVLFEDCLQTFPGLSFLICKMSKKSPPCRVSGRLTGDDTCTLQKAEWASDCY